MIKEIMSPERLKDSLAIKDLTDPKNGIHSINIIVYNIINKLKEAYPDISFKEFRLNNVVSVKDNFDELLFPKNNLGRSSRYTRYVDNDTVLRTHTSAGIPVLLKKEFSNGINDTFIALPGICYRRDVVDKTHCSEPHQIDIWRVKCGNPRLDRSDLIYLLETILNCIVPGYEYRANETQHPYTINGIEIEILVNGIWLEVMECGEINPIILENAGLDSRKYSGLALGMGIDRLAMIIKDIDDIRILRSNNNKIKSQLTDLDKYIRVSNQPETKRVLSYSTFLENTEEDVCEEILDEFGSNAIFVEDIEYSEIPYSSLLEKARVNLGIKPNQKNVIITLTFRSLTDSLPRKKINSWIEELYPKLNKGDKGYY